ncbi:MAG: type-X family DNA polymerase, partial [Planctomycetales bacterium]
MTNSQIAAVFDEIADILEFQGANSFRIRAYRNASRTIKDLPEPLSAIVEDDDRKLTDIQGIGKDLAEKIQGLLDTGKLKQLEDLKAKVSPDVLAMMRIPGLGPKKAAALHKELKIQNLAELKQACEKEQVRELKGFGAKTEETILKGLDIAATANERMLWADADAFAQALVEHLKSCPSLERIELAGSYRRGRETVGDLDILTVSTNADEIMDRFGSFPSVADVIVRGGTKMSIRLDRGLQVDLRVVPEESFGAALQYFTGSKNHNVVLRGMAKERGLKINEYG